LDVANEILKQDTYKLDDHDNAFCIALKYNHVQIAAKMLESPRKNLFTTSTANACTSFELSKETFSLLLNKVKGFKKKLASYFLPESLRKGVLKNVEMAIEKLVERDESESGEKKSGFTRLHLEVQKECIILTSTGINCQKSI
jgi:hypothetical protein